MHTVKMHAPPSLEHSSNTHSIQTNRILSLPPEINWNVSFNACVYDLCLRVSLPVPVRGGALADVVKVTSWRLAGAEIVPQKPKEVSKDAVRCECYL